MNVTLVDPPRGPWDLLGESVMPPLGLAYVAACLRERGHDVSIIDCNAEKIGWDGLEKRLRSTHPDVVGVGGETCHVYKAYRVFKMAKELGVEYTVAGGPHFTLNHREALTECPHLDYVVVGEGEITTAELLAALQSGREPRKILGVAYRRDGRPVYNGDRPLIEDLDSLPMPAFDLLPMEKYRLVAWGDRVTMLVSSRGCPYRCIFCSERVLWRGKWRAHSARRVVDMMEHLKDKYGKDIVWFGDDTFNLDRDRIVEICEEIRERGLDVWWGFEGRADLILRDKDIFGLMKDSGLFWVLIGVEAASDKELEAYDKGLSISHVKEAFRLLKQYDIISQAMFILGGWWETRESIKQKLKLAVELDPDFAIFTPLTPFPGTELYKMAEDMGLIEEYDLSKYDFAHFVMRSNSLSTKELRAFRSYCYRKFYRRPLKILRGVFSRNGFRRSLYLYFLRRFIM